MFDEMARRVAAAFDVAPTALRGARKLEKAREAQSVLAYMIVRNSTKPIGVLSKMLRISEENFCALTSECQSKLDSDSEIEFFNKYMKVLRGFNDWCAKTKGRAGLADYEDKLK